MGLAGELQAALGGAVKKRPTVESQGGQAHRPWFGRENRGLRKASSRLVWGRGAPFDASP